MNNQLVKAHEIIIENQRNADNKSYIFIVLISTFLGFMGKIPLNAFSPDEQQLIQYFFLVTLLPLLAFVVSLFPIYRNNYRAPLLRSKDIEVNIFYWRSLSCFKNFDLFLENYQKKYEIDKLDSFDSDLLSQIYSNAMILEYKKQLHGIAFFIINQFFVLISISLIGFYIFKSNVILTVITFIIIQALFFIRICNLDDKIIRVFKKK